MMMAEPLSAEQRLVSELDRSKCLRARALEDDTYAARRTKLREWQARRLARTHADLLESPRFHAGTDFFLTDLYGTKDLSESIDEVRRVVPAMVRVLPTSALETIADAIELAALSEDLDAALVGALGPHEEPISAAAYAAAYRKVGRRSDRIRQIGLIARLGQSLDSLKRKPFVGVGLRMMRKPAAIAGFGRLHSFLERGYAAFRMMSGSAEFLTIVAEREMQVSEALFSGDDSVLG